MGDILMIILLIIAALLVLLIMMVVVTKMVENGRQASGKKWRPNDLWEDRKRNWLGLPWTFTRYSLDPERFYLDKGILTSTSDEVRLYRITDISLERTLWQKIIGTGTIHVSSSDKSLHNFSIVNVKRPDEVRELLSHHVEKQREAKRVYARENMVTDMDVEEDFDGAN